MKSAQIMRYGEPDVLRVNDIERPVAGPGEVLVAVEASSVNGHDALVRAGRLRIVSGRCFPVGTGLDFAGVVAAAGPGVTAFRTGDRVWGMVHPRRRHESAGAAQYVAVPARRLAPAPAGLTPVQAASLVVAGSTALVALRDHVRLAAGERVLVRGAAGGVGTALVQLAHAFGGRVTALARSRYADALRELGADEVLDRGAADVRRIGPFDVVVDTVGTELAGYRGRLAKGGRMVTVSLSGRAMAAIGASGVHGPRRIRAFSVNPEGELLRAVGEQIVAGALRPVVAGVHELADIAAAHAAFERGGTVGKQMVAVPN